MNLEKVIHDHLLTKWLKVIIFAILMLAPIFSVAIRCAYVVCNKNAYQSYSGETQQNGTYANIQFNDMNIGSEYYTFVSQPTWFDTNANSMNIYVSNVKTYGPMNYSNGITYNIDETDYITVWFPQNNSRYIIAFELHKTGESQYYYINSTNAFNFSFTYEGVMNVNDNAKTLFSNYLYILEYLDKQYLDNVFDYSVNELRNDQLFNWTQNTAVYTGVNAMCTGLGMNDGTIAILLTYWMLLTIIYVIIDIVLEGFVLLTHMIYKKAN